MLVSFTTPLPFWGGTNPARVITAPSGLKSGPTRSDLDQWMQVTVTWGIGGQPTQDEESEKGYTLTVLTHMEVENGCEVCFRKRVAVPFPFPCVRTSRVVPCSAPSSKKTGVLSRRWFEPPRRIMQFPRLGLTFFVKEQTWDSRHDSLTWFFECTWRWAE